MILYFALGQDGYGDYDLALYPNRDTAEKESPEALALFAVDINLGSLVARSNVTEARRSAARANGKKGGRPKKCDN